MLATLPLGLCVLMCPPINLLLGDTKSVSATVAQSQSSGRQPGEFDLCLKPRRRVRISTRLRHLRTLCRIHIQLHLKESETGNPGQASVRDQQSAETDGLLLVPERMEIRQLAHLLLLDIWDQH